MVATGRSDFPNQLSNSLVFPGLFRGVLDVRPRTVSDGIAAALAAFAQARRLRGDVILPRMDDWKCTPAWPWPRPPKRRPRASPGSRSAYEIETGLARSCSQPVTPPRC